LSYHVMTRHPIHLDDDLRIVSKAIVSWDSRVWCSCHSRSWCSIRRHLY
jgi:hypothetical protein